LGRNPAAWAQHCRPAGCASSAFARWGQRQAKWHGHFSSLVTPGSADAWTREHQSVTHPYGTGSELSMDGFNLNLKHYESDFL
jgi:hypothetical protein